MLPCVWIMLLVLLILCVSFVFHVCMFVCLYVFTVCVSPLLVLLYIPGTSDGLPCTGECYMLLFCELFLCDDLRPETRKHIC